MTADLLEQMGKRDALEAEVGMFHCYHLVSGNHRLKRPKDGLGLGVSRNGDTPIAGWFIYNEKSDQNGYFPFLVSEFHLNFLN